MDHSPEKYIDRLLEISTKKLERLKGMLALTQRQTEVIHEDGVEKLEALIQQKQEQIEAINTLDEHFNVYFQRLKSELKVKSLDELKNIEVVGLKEFKEVVAQIMVVIKEISALEKQNDEKAKALLGALGQEIRKVNVGKKVNVAYGAPAGRPPSYFIDKKK